MRVGKRWGWSMVVLLTAVWSCKHGQCKDGGSSSADRHSHNEGENCRSCHDPDGRGEYCWNVGGTVYDHYGNGAQGVQVLLFNGPGGTGGVHVALTTDRNGNVYTSQDINFGYGLHPAVVQNGDTSFMTIAIQDGACNRCHGVSTDRVLLP